MKIFINVDNKPKLFKISKRGGRPDQIYIDRKKQASKDRCDKKLTKENENER